MNKDQVRELSIIFTRLVQSGRHCHGKYSELGDDGHWYYSPLGYLIAESTAVPPNYDETEVPISSSLVDIYAGLLKRVYGFTHIEQLEFIQREWLDNHDEGDLVRYPQMIMPGEVWG